MVQPLERRREATSPHGLTGREAARRLVAYGPNELAAVRRRGVWRDLADQLLHPLALLLWLAAALSAATDSTVLAGAVVLVIGLNAAFAFVQERQGERAVEALGAYLPQTALVLRDGRPERDRICTGGVRGPAVPGHGATPLEAPPLHHVAGVSGALGMAVPPGWALAVLPAFAVVVWGADELVRAARRARG